MTLTNKIVLVTGASSGIGEACARKFAESGAKVIMVARRIDRLQKLAKALSTPTHVGKLDVRNRAEVEKFVGSLPDDWRSIDILVNNAGLSRDLKKVQEANVDGWDEMIDTNVKGLLYVTRAVLPGMIQRNQGHIINIGSIAGTDVYPGGHVYCATKFAVHALTRGIMMDVVDTPIRVSSVDPGLVETEFSEVRFWGKETDRAKNVYKGYMPLTGDDIADAVVWTATRPAHVQVAQLVILPTAQAGAMVVHKNL